METKAGSRQLGPWANSASFSLSLCFSVFVSVCCSQSFTAPTRNNGEGEEEEGGIVGQNTKQEDNSLFPSTADVICVPLNCCILCNCNSQSHCVERAPGLSACLLLAGFMAKLQKTQIYIGICAGLIEFYPQSMKGSTSFFSDTLNLPLGFPYNYFYFPSLRPLLSFTGCNYSPQMHYMFFFLFAFS